MWISDVMYEATKGWWVIFLYGDLVGSTKTIKINTPWKINMEPKNHPYRKENDLPNLHDYVPC